MTFIIDAHQDLAYNMLCLGRDYRRAAHETRALEAGTPLPQRAGGDALLGWPDYQRGKIALIFATLFLSPKRHSGEWDTQAYVTPAEARRLHMQQFDAYQRLCDENPALFRLVHTRADLNAVLAPWHSTDGDPNAARPVGLVVSMEGAEGVRDPREFEEWWQLGLRLVGPVWAGGHWCGGMFEPGGFTRDGRQLLEVLANLGYTLDISHMNEESALQALDAYEGTLIASHANARALLPDSGERQLTDRTIRGLVERDGVMGLVPYNRFLRRDWTIGDPRERIPLDMLAAHIDHVCQLAGNARHVALGTDFDGGFGYPAVPLELNTIADLQKIGPLLRDKGYQEDDIQAILHDNWLRILERTLPA